MSDEKGGGFFAAIIAIAALAGAGIGYICRGKKENKRHAETQKVIQKLEDRLREVEKELADVKDLSIARIQELKAEKEDLLAQIATERRAA